MRTGIIGVGGIGTGAHLPAYHRIPDMEIAALCDKSGERLDRFARRFQVPSVYTNHREMSKAENLDAVSGCMINCMYAQITIDALEAGKSGGVKKMLLLEYDHVY